MKKIKSISELDIGDIIVSIYSNSKTYRKIISKDIHQHTVKAELLDTTSVALYTFTYSDFYIHSMDGLLYKITKDEYDLLRI